MKNLLKSIFELNGFLSESFEDFTVYYHQKQSKKREYWVVIEGQGDEVIKRQAAIAHTCQKNIAQDDLEKNSSLLIIENVNSQEEYVAKKLNAVSIEEDPYHFKKYLLIYADTEVKDLCEQAGEVSIDVFLTKIILEPNCFSAYKSDPKKLSWQALVYKLANKLPFIKIKVATNKGLKPLFESNLTKIGQKNLDGVNDAVLSLSLDYTKDELANLSGAEIMKIFAPIMMNKDEDK